jgi:uncharacterized membrane protein YeaQ/YmgE (transglycosylase-associated protein family)
LEIEQMIGALILGLVAGFIGKALMPGKDPGGFFATILIGLAGAALGWAIFTLGLGIGDDDAFDLGGLLGAIVGVMILLFAYRKFVESRQPATTAAPAAAASERPARRAGRAGGRRRNR